ncbi:5'-AMP-activated protein kinase subunit gamma-2-like isoform X7 [Varroa destructor]|uniref:CBS domain-containing protein n=1 Tax=Varroa destructor TaxID=109461 RepID=A0A7M7KHX4_VARDE|nr:5'-AMP-activated protein kinase subunit gamma-2-like isoform X7 [Varroa destructor]
MKGVKSDFGSTRKVMATSADAAYFRYLHGVHADVTGKTSTVAETLSLPGSPEQGYEAMEAPQRHVNSPFSFRSELVCDRRVRHLSSTEDEPISPSGCGSHSKESSSSQTHSSAILETFRPRSKSDSKELIKHHKPPASNIMSALKNSVHTHNWFSTSGGGSLNGSNSPSSSPTYESPHGPLSFSGHSGNQSPSTLMYPSFSDGFDYRPQQRPRSGSESKSGAVAKVMDMFRARSQSMSLTTDGKAKLTSSDTSICEDRIDIEDLGADESLLFVKFFRYYHCYDLIPLSAKLVVFDTQLQVKKAFFALESNGVRAAPLWDSAQQQFVGMLTISDFIQMLRKYYRNPQLQMDELEQHKIDTWRTVLTNMQRLLVSIGPDASLCDAIIALIHQRVHRLPVIDPQTGNVLYVLTHKRILRFLFLYFYDLPHSTYLDKSIRELNVGTFENIATCTPDTPLIVALDTFVERRVSALPVVANDGRVVDIYAKFDVINLAAEKTYSKLDMSVGQALEFRNEFFEGVLTCSADDSLLELDKYINRVKDFGIQVYGTVCDQSSPEVMKKIVVAEVHRLVIADDNGCCVGIVSLSDILLFLVLNPLGMERPASRAYLMRTTSSERENGPVAEEPELEATANAFGEQAVVNSWRRSSTLDDTELRSSVDLPLEMPGSLF